MLARSIARAIGGPACRAITGKTTAPTTYTGSIGPGNAQVDYTSTIPGVSVTHAAAESGTTTLAAVAKVVTVSVGSKARMIVTGTLSDGTDPVNFTTLNYAGIINEKASYSTAIYWENTLSVWVLYKVNCQWTSTSAEDWPDDIPEGDWNADTNPNAWKPVDPATGTPALAAAASTALGVAKIVNNSGGLVRATIPGTGASAAVEGTATLE